MLEHDSESEYQGDITGDVAKFEAFLKGESLPYLDVEQWEALIDHYLVVSQYNKAIKCCDAALTIFSFENVFQLRKAQALSALGELKEGLNVLNWLEKQGVQDCEMMLTKASIFSQLKDSKKAIKYYQFALGLADPEEQDEIYLDIAMEYENLNEYDKAIEILKQAIDRNPKHEFALYELGQCYEHLEDGDSAIQCYLNYIDDNPYSYTAWYNLGNAYLKQQNYEKAIWAFDYSTLIQPDFGPGYFNMANVYFTLEKYKNAIEHFKACLEHEGDDPLVFCYLGECYEHLDELSLAKFYYQKSMDMAPELVDAWVGMGVVFDLEDRTFEALAFFHRAIELEPDNADAYHVLGAALEKLQDEEAALDSYLKAVELEEEDGEALADAMRLYMQLDVLAALEFILSMENQSEEPFAYAEWVISAYYNAGRKKDALSLFHKWLAVDPMAAEQLFEVNPDLRDSPEFGQFN